MGHYGLPKYFVVIIATQVARFATVYKIVTMAEVVGFELTVPCDTTVFKTAPIDLSGTLPLFGATGQIRTDGFRDLQSLALGLSATVAFYSSS